MADKKIGITDMNCPNCSEKKIKFSNWHRAELLKYEKYICEYCKHEFIFIDLLPRVTYSIEASNKLGRIKQF